MPSVQFLDDTVGIGGPDEGFGFAVVLAEIAVDRGLQVDERAEDAALQSPAGEGGEEALDRIGPGARGGCEMKGPARMAGEPGAHFGPASLHTLRQYGILCLRPTTRYREAAADAPSEKFRCQ